MVSYRHLYYTLEIIEECRRTTMMKGTPTKRVYFTDEHSRVTETAEEVEEFTNEVEEGDYVAFVYPTPSNAGSLHRAMGHVSEVETLDGRFDGLRFEVAETDNDGAGDEGYLHLNPGTGDYYFTDGDDDLPADGWEVERLHHTPEEHV